MSSPKENEWEAFHASVIEFNKVFGNYRTGNRGLYSMLLTEEHGELVQAYLKGKGPEKEVEELLDCIYVLLGYAETAGLDVQHGLRKVREKNNNKIANREKMVLSSAGKVVKPGIDQDEMIT